VSEAPARVGKCVICDKPKDEHYKPFCSKRCADVDLHRWFAGTYAIAAEEGDTPDGSPDDAT
jgi:endogenous inhibitor of DNA gyrase (YacG/DUF329 family)